MIGYVVNSGVGAITYNIAHHKALAIVIGLAGLYTSNQDLILAGVRLLAHSSMDRAVGYGLNYFDSFKHTHLGVLGKS